MAKYEPDNFSGDPTANAIMNLVQVFSKVADDFNDMKHRVAHADSMSVAEAIYMGAGQVAISIEGLANSINTLSGVIRELQFRADD